MKVPGLPLSLPVCRCEVARLGADTARADDEPAPRWVLPRAFLSMSATGFPSQGISATLPQGYTSSNRDMGVQLWLRKIRLRRLDGGSPRRPPARKQKTRS